MDNKLMIAIVTSVAGLIGMAITHLLNKKKESNVLKKTSLEIEQLTITNSILKSEQEAEKESNKIMSAKTTFYDEVVKLVLINSIQESVNKLFKTTSADRVLILTARNGKNKFSKADAVLDFYKNSNERIDAVTHYSNVPLDDLYVKLLHNVENHGSVDLETKTMKNQGLKFIYELEGLKHSRIMNISRFPIDDENDFLLYMSISSHGNTPFSKKEKTIQDIYLHNSFKPSLLKLLKKPKK